MRYSDHKVIALIIITGFLLLMTTSAMAIGTGDGNLLKRSVEETCHACHKTDRNARTDADSVKTHSAEWLGTCSNTNYTNRTDCIANGGTWTSKWGSAGWGIPGGKYGEFVCTTCHTPHDTKNIYLMRESVTAPNSPTDNFPGSTIDFRTLSGNPGDPGLMGDDTGGHTTSTRVCEVCHSQNKYHNYNTANNTGGLDHNNAKNCTDCHSHLGAFRASCDACHGNPPTTATIGGPTGLATPPTGATNPLSPGAHQVHVSSRGMTCYVCHRGTAMPASEKLIDMGFSVSSASYPAWAGPAVESGTFTGYNALLNGYAWNASWAGTTVNTAPNYDNRCSSIYCHGSTLTGGTNTSPSWVGGSAEAACGTCHGASASTPPTAGSHTKHASSASGNLNLACTKCHPAVTDGSHVNGSVAWDLDDTDSRIGASATYRGSNAGQTGQLAPSATYGSCSNIYCHSTVQPNGGTGSPTYASPTWGGSVTCSSCHVDMSSSPSATGSHIKHAQTQGYACSICHSGAGSGTTAHANYNIDVAFSGTATGGSYSQASNPPGNGYGTCSTIYCHGTTTPAWGGASLTCEGCHYGNNTLAGKHSVHYATDTVATSSSFTPSNNSTTTAYTYSCGVCHNATSHAQGPVSANQAAQVSFDATVAGGGTYTAGALVGADRGFNWTAGTCSSTYCHSNGAGGAPNNTTFNWNSPSGTLGCNGCHNYTKASGTPMATGSHTAHINNADAALATFNCYRCHNATTTNDTSIADKSLHVNKTKNVNFDTLNPSGSYTSPNCSNLYCHSTGKTLTDVPAGNLPAIYGGSHFTTMSWGGAGIGCNGCHGRSVSAGAPDYTSTGQGAAGANSHMAHTGNGTNSESCDTCHTNTTNTGTSINPDSTLHLNTTRDVTFNTTKAGAGAAYTAGTKQCSNLACHGTSQWGGPSQTCVSCHSAALGNRRQITATDSSPSGSGDVYTGTTGGDFIRPSRHVSNGTTTQYISKWDCIVCHMEGDTSTGRTSALHTGTPGSNADVNLRNVDSYTTGWAWNRFTIGTLPSADQTIMRNNMDRFCLSCHDSDESADTLITLEPNGAGTTSGWTYQGGASNYYNLSTNDGDTTRIQTTTNNAIHLFNLDDPDTSFISDVATVASVTVKAVARLNATGDDQIKLVVRTGGTNYFSSAITLTGGTTYTTYSATWTTNPGGGSWTGAQIRALEAGVQYIQVGGTATQINVTQLWVEVDFGSLNPDIGTGTKLVWGTNLGGASTIAVNSTNNGLLLGTAVSRRMTPWNTNATYRNTYEYSTIKTERNNRGMTIPDVRGDFNSQGLKGKGWASHHNLNIFPKRYWTNNTTYLPTGVWTSYVTKEGQTLNDPNVGVTAGLHCSDCHLNEVNAHGSVNTRYMLSDMNGNDAAYTNGVYTTATHVCAKCHNRAVYAQNGSGTDSQFPHQDMCQNPANPTDSDYPTATHLGNRSSAGDGNSGFGSNLPCLACHGGVDFGSIHGSNAKYVPGGQVGITKRYRFMSGGAMRFFRPGATTPVTDSTWEETGTAGIACYTLSAADNFGSCTQHSGGRSENQTRQRLLEY